MTKVTLIIFLAFIYLGLSTMLKNDDESGTIFINDKYQLSSFFKGREVAIVLLDIHETGFLIKSYYQVYKVFEGIGDTRMFSVKTSRRFKNENLPFVGMNIFYRKDDFETYVPFPPGAHYLGNPTYGTWQLPESGAGSEIWSFHRPYKNFPFELGWDTFVPDQEFYKKLKIYLSQGKPFFGNQNEFGPGGFVTKNYLQGYFGLAEKSKKDLIDLYKKKYFATQTNL